jgi:hypothetical protein
MHHDAQLACGALAMVAVRGGQVPVVIFHPGAVYAITADR